MFYNLLCIFFQCPLRQVVIGNFSAGGADFFEGVKDNDAAGREARQWIDAVLNDTKPCVLPEQALCVTRILEAIYTSSATGKPVYFD